YGLVQGRRAALSRAFTSKVLSMAFCLRSEEHTSELQSLTNLVCRLLLEKKKKKQDTLIALPARCRYQRTPEARQRPNPSSTQQQDTPCQCPCTQPRVRT